MIRNPQLSTDEGREDEYGPYVLEGHTTPLLPSVQGTIPKRWIHIIDDVVFEAVVADGKPKNVLVLMGFDVEAGRILPRAVPHIIRQDGKGGYYVWHYPDVFTPEFQRSHFRSLRELIIHPRSIVGMALRGQPRSRLYYDPTPLPKNFDPEPKQEPKKNPYGGARQLGMDVLKARRLHEHWGLVVLARTDDGRFAVWADDSNTLSVDDDFRRRYGYPAVYDLRYYGRYAPAQFDFERRRDIYHPVPIGGT